MPTNTGPSRFASAAARIERDVSYGGNGEKTFARQEWDDKTGDSHGCVRGPFQLKLQLRIVVSVVASRSCTITSAGRPRGRNTLGFVGGVGDAA
jgi:hypothetical protein